MADQLVEENSENLIFSILIQSTKYCPNQISNNYKKGPHTVLFYYRLAGLPFPSIVFSFIGHCSTLLSALPYLPCLIDSLSFPFLLNKTNESSTL